MAFVIKRLLYIEFRVFRKKTKKELEVQKRPKEATTHLRVWVMIEVSSVAIELFGSVLRHGSQAAGGGWVATGVFLVATELFSPGFLLR